MTRTNQIIDEIYDGKKHYAEVLFTTYMVKNRIQKAILDFSTVQLTEDVSRHKDHNFSIEGEIIDVLCDDNNWYNNKEKLVLKTPAKTFAKACKVIGLDIRTNHNKYMVEFKVVNKKKIMIKNMKELKIML